MSFSIFHKELDFRIHIDLQRFFKYKKFDIISLLDTLSYLRIKLTFIDRFL